MGAGRGLRVFRSLLGTAVLLPVEGGQAVRRFSVDMSAQSTAFTRLIRFRDAQGNDRFGDAPLELDLSKVEEELPSVTLLEGSVKHGFTRTEHRATVEKVSSNSHPLPRLRR
jgi:hypothetical protein